MWSKKRNNHELRERRSQKPRDALAEVTNIEIKNGEADVTAPDTHSLSNKNGFFFFFSKVKTDISERK